MPADPAPDAEAGAAPDAVTLKIDWDRQPSLVGGDGGGGTDGGAGHHVVREDAGRALADFIGRRDAGALLVVGRRGSGKTSSVIDAANRAARQGTDGGRTVMPIMVKATSLDAEDKRPGRALLGGLIWALRAGIKSDGGMDKDELQGAERLYQDVTAAENSTEVSQSETRTGRLSINATPAAAAGLIAAGLTPAAWALQDALYPAWLAVPAAAMLPLAFRLWWDRRTVAASASRRRSVYGLADAQHDFEALLCGLGRRRKIVFILDEFDKADHFYDMLRPLKMLLNQGGALYVIITAPDRAQDALERRSPDHTLFSEILFINRPLFSEMDRFLDDIVDGAAPAGAAYDDFKHCMRYKSQTDFFSLYGALRDRRVGIDGEGRPLVRIALGDSEMTEANVQRAIEEVYRRKEYGAQSMQMANDEMLDAMYGAADMAQKLHGHAIPVKNIAAILDKKGVRSTPHGLSAAQDLFCLLARQGYLKAEGDESYKVIGTLSSFTAGGVLVEEEREFRRAYDDMIVALVNFANVQTRLVDGGAAPYTVDAADSRLDDMTGAVEPVVDIDVSEEERQCRASLRQQSLPMTEPDKLREYTSNARSMLGELRRHAVDLLSAVLEKNGFDMEVSDTIDDSLHSLRSARGDDVRNAVWRRPDGGDDTSVRAAVSIVHVKSPALISEMHGEVEKIRGPVGEIIIALLDGGALPDDQWSAIAVGPRISAPGGPAGPDALEMARRHSVYVLAVPSPPDVETVETLVNAIKMIAERIEPGRRGRFSPFWRRLLDAARAPPTAKTRISWVPPSRPVDDYL